MHEKTIVITGHGQISTEIQTWTHNPRAEYAQRLDPILEHILSS